MANDNKTEILRELLNWTRVGFYGAVKYMLSDVLNTENKRLACQMADGTKSRDMIKTAAAMGSDSVTELFRQCVSLGLMELTEDGKRNRLFDLSNFGLMPQIEAVKTKGAGGGNK